MAWLKEEDDFLRRYPNEEIKVLADALGKTRGDVSKRRCILGIKQDIEVLPEGYKRCSKCKKIKKKTDFYRNKTNSDGYQSFCKECDNIIKIERNNMKAIEKMKQEKLKKIEEANKKIAIKKTKTYICKHCKKEIAGTDFYYLKNGARMPYCKACNKIINNQKKCDYYKNKNYCK